MLTKDGDWCFVKSYRVMREVLTPAEAQLYEWLSFRAHSPGLGPRALRYAGKAEALERGQLRTTLRDLEVVTGRSDSTVYRMLKSLDRRGFIAILERTRGANGGMILHVRGPDQIPQLRVLRASRLKQMLNELMPRLHKEKSQELIVRVSKLKQALKQLVAHVSYELDKEIVDSVNAAEASVEALLKTLDYNSYREAPVYASGHADAERLIRNSPVNEPKKSAEILKPVLNDADPEPVAPTPWEEKERAFRAAFPSPEARKAELLRMAKEFPWAGWRRRQPDGYQGASPAGTAAERRLWPVDEQATENRQRLVTLWFETTEQGRLEKEYADAVRAVKTDAVADWQRRGRKLAREPGNTDGWRARERARGKLF